MSLLVVYSLVSILAALIVKPIIININEIVRNCLSVISHINHVEMKSSMITALKINAFQVLGFNQVTGRSISLCILPPFPFCLLSDKSALLKNHVVRASVLSIPLSQLRNHLRTLAHLLLILAHLRA